LTDLVKVSRIIALVNVALVDLPPAHELWHQRYSQTAIKRIQDLLDEKCPEQIWQEYREPQRAG
jgi:hypothetical protein